MTKPETITILATIGAVYQSFSINEFKQGIWHELLKDVEYQFAATALIKTLKESKFPPTPADIIERAGVEAFIVNGRAEIEGHGNKSIT